MIISRKEEEERYELNLQFCLVVELLELAVQYAAQTKQWAELQRLLDAKKALNHIGKLPEPQP